MYKPTPEDIKAKKELEEKRKAWRDAREQIKKENKK